MTCQARLHDGPLRCVRPLGHAFGHVYESTPADDTTEPRGH